MKYFIITLKRINKVSPPTRVVWIEIPAYLMGWDNEKVTTHTGGVD